MIAAVVSLAASAPALARAQAPFTLAAAGDIACTPGETSTPPNGTANGPDGCQQAGTAALIEHLQPGAVAALGDLQYEFGTLAEFDGSFASTWGLFKSEIYPAPGNHEWNDLPVNGAGYFDYFDGTGTNTGRAGTRGKGYYSVNLNHRWHLITLNSNCTRDNSRLVTPVACNPGSAQERWLRADLRAHRGMCIIAQWHHPYFTSGPSQGGANNRATRPFWNDLYRAGATLILDGHDHGYQRFARQTPAGRIDRRHGVREFVVGTGGKSLFGPGPRMAAHSQVYNVTTYGVMLFTLYAHSYHWHFYGIPEPGNGTLADQGSAPCNTPPPATRG